MLVAALCIRKRAREPEELVAGAVSGGGGSVWSRDIVDTMSRDIVDSGVNYVNGYF